MVETRSTRMKIHEYQAKAILAAHGVPVPHGEVVFDAARAKASRTRLGGGTVVVKAQIHAGGRGKGGGVKVVKGPEAAAEGVAATCSACASSPTRPARTGRWSQRVLVEQGLRSSASCTWASSSIAPAEKPVLMASPDGGVEIEKVADETPERIFKEFIHPGVGLAPYQTRKLAFALGLEGPQVAQAGKLMTAVYDDVQGDRRLAASRSTR